MIDKHALTKNLFKDCLVNEVIVCEVEAGDVGQHDGHL